MPVQFVDADPGGPEVNWSYQKMPEKARVNVCWVGPVHGLQTHHAGQTKPCLKDFTAGLLHCPWCEAKLAKRWRGYAPAVEFGRRQIVFLVGQTCGAKLSLVQAGARLTFGRGEGETAPVEFAPYQGLAANSIDERFRPGGVYYGGVKLLPWLLRLWEIPELTDLVEKGG